MNILHKLRPALWPVLLLLAVLPGLGARSLTFPATGADNSYSWWLTGTGNDVEMSMIVSNHLGETLFLTIPSGTVFLPTSSSVQRMLVRKKVLFTIPAGERRSVTVPVLCMDISKDPPAPGDSSWSVRFDKDMASFLDFTSELSGQLAQEITSRPDGMAVDRDDLQHAIERYSVWRYQGASQQDIGKFLREYGGDPNAERDSAMLTQISDLVIQMYRER